jgi:beta-glucosidase
MSDPLLYLQEDAPIERRVEDLLGRMTPEEKLGQLNLPAQFDPVSGTTPPRTFEEAERLVTGEYEERLGPIGGFFALAGFTFPGDPAEQANRHAHLQRLAREGTRLGIPLLQVAEGCHGLMAPGATVFPEGAALGSSWDPDLIREVYEVVAREARATGVHLLCTLVIEPNRDPRLGRNCEAYSECPYLTQSIAHAIVAGIQGDDVSAPDRAGAVLTCFPGQSEPISGMERGAMEMSERTLRSNFLPPWTAASGPGGALCVMATYASIDGIPAHASEYWMTEVLRGELGFQGLVASEGHGFETIQYEGIVETQKEAGVLSLRAGVDASITYEQAFLTPLLESLDEGLVAEELLDRAVRRVLTTKFRLGLFDEPTEQPAGRGQLVHRVDHVELALRAAREGIVLLKNEGGLLPLSKQLGRVAVIGPNADNARNLLGDYVVADVSQPIETVLDAVRSALEESTEVLHERGCDETDPADAAIDSAVAAARVADVAIVVVGERSGFFSFRPRGDGPTIGERFDVRSLDLSGRQQTLVEAVHATGTPVVMVLVNGRPLSVRWAAEHVPAIVEAWLPGEQGAQAIVDVLFGDHNPSARLPVTVPAHVGQLPAYYNFKPSKEYWLGFGGFVDGGGKPLFPFGHGLSYTTFEYTDLRVSQEFPGSEWVAEVSLSVRNTGQRAGYEVVQLYVRDRFSSVATPDKELRGFEKIALEPGARATVRFMLTPTDLALLDAGNRLVVEPGVFELMVGASSEDIRLSAELTIDQESQLPGRIVLAPIADRVVG